MTTTLTPGVLEKVSQPVHEQVRVLSSHHDAKSSVELLEDYLDDCIEILKIQSEFSVPLEEVSVEDLKKELIFMFHENLIWPNVLHDQRGNLVLHWIWDDLHVRAVRLSGKGYNFKLWRDGTIKKSKKIKQAEFLQTLTIYMVKMSELAYSTKDEWQSIFKTQAWKARLGVE